MKSKQNRTPWEDAILIVEKFWNTIALASEPSSINYWCSRWDRDVCGRGCWWREGWVRARGESFFRPNRGVKVSSGDVDVPVSEEGVRFVSKWPHGNGRSPKVARSLRPRTIANASETATMLNVANCALFSHVIKSRIKEAVRPVIVHPSLGVVNAARTAASIDDSHLLPAGPLRRTGNESQSQGSSSQSTRGRLLLRKRPERVLILLNKYHSYLCPVVQ